MHENQDQDNTLVNIPVSDEQQQRDAFLFDEELPFRAGDDLISPGQAVPVFYVLIEGRIDVIRDFGDGREGRTSFSFNKGVDAWRPILGGRYFFTQRPSSQRYLCMTDCKVMQITHETLRGKLYLTGRCIAIIRELLRCSDMPEGSLLHAELAKRHDLLGFPGFDISTPERLLTVDARRDTVGATQADTAAIERIKAGLVLMDKEYVDFSREMVRRLLGEDVDASQNGETHLGFNAPPLRT